MNTLNLLQNTKFDLNPSKTEIKSTIRNNIKKDLMKEIAENLGNHFQDNENIEVGLTTDGVAVSVYNTELDENITFVLDATFKKFDYDLNNEVEDYIQTQLEKEKAKAEKEKLKKSKIESDKLAREKKKLEKQLANKIAKGEVKKEVAEKVLGN